MIDYLEDFYTHFTYQQIAATNGNVIGVATFTKNRPNYPKTAIVKTTPSNPSARGEVQSTLRFKDFKNIIQIYAYYRTKENIVLFLEHCENGSLDKYLEAKTTAGHIIPAGMLLQMMLDISQALEQLHSHHAAHRDIKPHNIFITSDMICKLGDLETVKKIDEEEKRNLQSRFVGTVEYMAPEKRSRFLNEELKVPTKNHDMFAEDLWALGKTFYEMCVGKVETADIFEPSKRRATTARILSELRARDYPADLAPLINSLLFSARDTSLVGVVSGLHLLQQEVTFSGTLSPSRRSDPMRGSGFPQQPQCILCFAGRASGSEVLTLPTKCHTVCASCLLKYLDTCTKRNQFSEIIGCPVCLRPIPNEFICDLAGVSTAVVSYVGMMTEISSEQQCPCGKESFSKVVRHGLPKPYLFFCKEKNVRLCSWCMKVNGHKRLFRKNKNCSKFPYYKEIDKLSSQ